MQVLGFSIINQKGANGIIHVLLANGSEHQVIYQQSQMHHFNAACSMLHSNYDVYFDQGLERFRSVGTKTYNPSVVVANFVESQINP